VDRIAHIAKRLSANGHSSYVVVWSRYSLYMALAIEAGLASNKYVTRTNTTVESLVLPLPGTSIGCTAELKANQSLTRLSANFKQGNLKELFANGCMSSHRGRPRLTFQYREADDYGG
jgi:hypothetical protein